MTLKHQQIVTVSTKIILLLLSLILLLLLLLLYLVSPHYWQACTVGATPCVMVLLSANVPTDIRDQTDLTPVMCAQINNHSQLVDLITNHEQRVQELGH